jgi:hypothetical protein
MFFTSDDRAEIAARYGITVGSNETVYADQWDHWGSWVSEMVGWFADYDSAGDCSKAPASSDCNDARFDRIWHRIGVAAFLWWLNPAETSQYNGQSMKDLAISNFRFLIKDHEGDLDSYGAAEDTDDWLRGGGAAMVLAYDVLYDSLSAAQQDSFARYQWAAVQAINDDIWVEYNADLGTASTGYYATWFIGASITTVSGLWGDWPAGGGEMGNPESTNNDTLLAWTEYWNEAMSYALCSQWAGCGSGTLGGYAQFYVGPENLPWIFSMKNAYGRDVMTERDSDECYLDCTVYNSTSSWTNQYQSAPNIDSAYVFERYMKFPATLMTRMTRPGFETKLPADGVAGHYNTQWPSGNGSFAYLLADTFSLSDSVGVFFWYLEDVISSRKQGSTFGSSVGLIWSEDNLMWPGILCHSNIEKDSSAVGVKATIGGYSRVRSSAVSGYSPGASPPGGNFFIVSHPWDQWVDYLSDRADADKPSGIHVNITLGHYDTHWPNVSAGGYEIMMGRYQIADRTGNYDNSQSGHYRDFGRSGWSMNSVGVGPYSTQLSGYNVSTSSDDQFGHPLGVHEAPSEFPNLYSGISMDLSECLDRSESGINISSEWIREVGMVDTLYVVIHDRIHADTSSHQKQLTCQIPWYDGGGILDGENFTAGESINNHGGTLGAIDEDANRWWVTASNVTWRHDGEPANPLRAQWSVFSARDNLVGVRKRFGPAETGLWNSGNNDTLGVPFQGLGDRWGRRYDWYPWGDYSEPSSSQDISFEHYHPESDRVYPVSDREGTFYITSLWHGRCGFGRYEALLDATTSPQNYDATTQVVEYVYHDETVGEKAFVTRIWSDATIADRGALPQFSGVQIDTFVIFWNNDDELF